MRGSVQAHAVRPLIVARFLLVVAVPAHLHSGGGKYLGDRSGYSAEPITKSDRLGENRKDRDIGYALAADSCEGVNNVDACTIAVLDVIAAFAVPNPNGSSQRSSVFSGPVVQQVAPPFGSISLLRTGYAI